MIYFKEETVSNVFKFLFLFILALSSFADDDIKNNCNDFFKSPLMTKYFESYAVDTGEYLKYKGVLPQIPGMTSKEHQELLEEFIMLSSVVSEKTVNSFFEKYSYKVLNSKTVASKINDRIEDIVVRYYQKNSDRPSATYITNQLGFRTQKAKSFFFEITQTKAQFDHYLAGLIAKNKISKLQIRTELVNALSEYTKKFKQFPKKTTLINYMSNILKKDAKFLKQLYPFLGNNINEFESELIKVYLKNYDELKKSGLDLVVMDDVNSVITEFLLSKKRLPQILELESKSHFPKEILEKQFKKIYDGRVLLNKELLSIVKNNPEVKNFARNNLTSALKKHFSTSYEFPVGENFIELADLINIDRKLMDVYYPESSSVVKTKKLILEILDDEQALFEKFRTSILKKYAKASEGKHELISERELARELDIELDSLKEFYIGKSKGKPFDDMKSLYAEAKSLFPKEFSKVKDTFHFDDSRVQRIFDASRDARVLALTSAVAGAKIPQKYLDAMENLVSHYKAAGFIHGIEQEVTHIDPKAFELERKNIFVAPPESVLHDEDIAVVDIGVTGKQINPFSGIKKRGPFGGLVIYPNPKVEGETIRTLAESNHQIFTTGMISGDNWFTDNLTKDTTQIRTNMFAQEDSGPPTILLVEKDDTIARQSGQNAYSTPTPRYVHWDDELGGFVDKDLVFYPDGRIGKREIEAIVLGDTHGTHLSEQHLPELASAIKKFKPRIVVHNDGIEGASVNHHAFDSDYYLNKMLASGELDVRAEIAKYVSLVDEFIRIGIEAYGKDFRFVELPGNHNKWFHYLVSKGWYKKHGAIYDDIVKVIQLGLDDGYDPLEYMVKHAGEFGFHTTAYPENLLFFKNGEDVVLNNGKQGSLKKEVAIHHGDMHLSLGSKKTAYESLITGHNHAKFTFKITKRGFQMGVGAITVDHTYFAGSASNVGMSYGILSKTLMPQVLQSEGTINTSFYLPEHLRKEPLDEGAKSSEYPKFFKNYQRIVEHDMENGGGADSVIRNRKNKLD